MNALEDYILNEFKDTQTEFAARNIKYSFNRTVSNKGVVNDVITMNIKIYDDNMNLLDSKAIKFINYKLAKPCEKKLVNIDVNELNVLFTKALDDIKNEIAKEYNAKINEFKETKNILFDITDTELLNKTGGIVQGMSGSPIIQGDNIVGSVTHVVVDNPEKGYGIYITNMLTEAEK